jgi:hypothetical protein
VAALGEDEVVAAPHFEDAAATGNELDLPDVRDGALDLGCQTGSPLVIASRGAVFDAELGFGGVCHKGSVTDGR